MKKYRVRYTFCCPGISDGNDYMKVEAETPEQADIDHREETADA